MSFRLRASAFSDQKNIYYRMMAEIIYYRMLIYRASVERIARIAGLPKGLPAILPKANVPREK
jgi:hypothetical protein